MTIFPINIEYSSTLRQAGFEIAAARRIGYETVVSDVEQVASAVQQQAKPTEGDVAAPVELSIVIPCLNEAETLAAVLDRAHRFLAAYNVSGEIIVADNGSTDGSIEIATAAGARVVHIQNRGYGAALSEGIRAATGAFVAMGDADNSYDFMGLMPFLEKLRLGADLVIGNRFLGGIGRGAMPLLHRYLGNPALSYAGRILYSAPVGDIYCGLRAFRRETILDLRLTSAGMEFASEMIVKAQLARLKIEEVPASLSKDGRSRPPHLQTWRDGWRTLKFLLIFSPRWLYVYPGLALLIAALCAFVFLLPGYQIIAGARLGVHSLLFAGAGILIGSQLTSFGLIASIFGVRESYWLNSSRLDRVRRLFTIDKGCAVGGSMIAAGMAGALFAFSMWARSGYGDMSADQLMRVTIPSVLLSAVGLQLMFTCFLVELLSQPKRDSEVGEPRQQAD